MRHPLCRRVVSCLVMCATAALTTLVMACEASPTGTPDRSRQDPAAPGVCGDDVIGADEACDGDDVDGATCARLGFGEGPVTCSACGFDVSACSGAASCGDGAIDATDVCDGTDLGGATCAALGFGHGPLGCADNCAAFDTSRCPPPTACVPACGEAVCGDDPVCGTSCGVCADGAQCEGGVCSAPDRCETRDTRCAAGECAITFDVPLFALRTQVLIDGIPPVDNPNDTVSEFQVRFTNAATGVQLTFDFQSRGVQTFLVPEGVWHIDVLPTIFANQPGLPEPLSTLRARTGFVVAADADVTFDVPLFALTTTVLLDGVAPVDNPNVGATEITVQFTDQETGARLFHAFKSQGPQTFLVPGGRWNVDLLTTVFANQPGVPRNSPLRARTGLVVAADVAVTLDAPLFALTTTILLDGAPPVDEPVDDDTEFQVRFTNTTTGARLFFDIQRPGPQTFLVPEGIWDVDVLPTIFAQQAGLPDQQSPLRARTGLMVNADAVVTFDVSLFALTTTVLIDGVAPVDNLHEGATEVIVRLTRAVTGDQLFYAFKSQGPQIFLVPGGTWDVDLLTTILANEPGIPRDSPLRSRTGLVVNADAAVTFDVPLFALTPTIRIDGATLVDNGAGTEAVLRFTHASSGAQLSSPVDVGDPGPVLVPGGTWHVDVSFTIFASAPGVARDSPVRSRTGLVVNADAAVTFNTDFTALTTTVLLDGRAPVDLGEGFREVIVRFTDVDSGEGYAQPFDSRGPEVFLVPLGTWDVDLMLAGAGAAPGVPLQAPLRATTCLAIGP
jgi:hypothetical protein